MVQTATEWLFETMAKTPMTNWYEIREQAKAMEKQQIINAWDKRVFRGTFVKGWHIERQNGEAYYNETYENNP